MDLTAHNARDCHGPSGLAMTFRAAFPSENIRVFADIGNLRLLLRFLRTAFEFHTDDTPVRDA